MLGITTFEWISLIFGGFGCLVIAWLWKKLKAVRRKKMTLAGHKRSTLERAALVSPVQGSSLQVTKGPSPAEITQAIKAAPPYSRKAIASNFEGAEIDWNLEFRQLLLSNDGATAIVRMETEKGFPVVQCSVPLESHGFLKFIHEQSELRITGSIVAASEFEIEVGPPDLSLWTVAARLVPVE